MENDFKIGEFVTLVKSNGKPFKMKSFNSDVNNVSETIDEIKGIIKFNRPMFDNEKRYIDRCIVVQVIGRIGMLHLQNSKIIRKKV